eukprot:361277-Chlamydomonas_euryale.AAC.8
MTRTLTWWTESRSGRSAHACCSVRRWLGLIATILGSRGSWALPRWRAVGTDFRTGRCGRTVASSERRKKAAGTPIETCPHAAFGIRQLNRCGLARWHASGRQKDMKCHMLVCIGWILGWRSCQQVCSFPARNVSLCVVDASHVLANMRRHGSVPLTLYVGACRTCCLLLPARTAEGSSLQGALHAQVSSDGSKKCDSKKRLSFRERHNKEQQELTAAGACAHWLQPRINPDNVGFSLLKRSGWKEGSGLGAQEQGRIAPVLPWLQKGNRGLGFQSKAAQEQNIPHQQKANLADEARAASHAAAAALGEKRKAFIGKMVADELKAEDMSTKVKRHRAVMRQDEDNAKRRAIGRMLSSQLNDPFDQPFSSGDSNPLGRHHRLSKLNPLIDSDDD